MKPELMGQPHKEDLYLLLPGTPVHSPPRTTSSELTSFRFPGPHNECESEAHTPAAVHTVCHRTAQQPLPELTGLCLYPI